MPYLTGRVAAGAIAEKYLRQAYGIEIVAFVTSVGKVSLTTHQPSTSSDENDDAADPLSEEFLETLRNVTRKEVDQYPTRCPHQETSEKMTARILRAKNASDSIGGTITCVVRNSPVGLGEPVFDKFEAMLAHAMLSIPATKGFEVGSGFRGTEVPGRNHNDPFVMKGDRLGTKTNWSGGIQGGITNGENIYFRSALVVYTNVRRLMRTSIAWGSNLQLPYLKHKKRVSTTVRLAYWPREDDMIRAWYREQFRLWKPWLL